MSEWMKEMERLTDEFGRASAELRVAGLTDPNASNLRRRFVSTHAALLAHAAQRDHIEDVLGMVPAPAAPEHRCDMGVGCEMVGVCYAKAQGRPELCPETHTQPQSVELPEHVEQLAITRYRPVPNGMFGYKVVAGDGARSVFEGTKSECTLIARKLTEAFLDGAHVAGDAREAAGYARGLKEADKLLLEAPRWRDVADELPQEAQEVLFVRSGKTVHGAWIGGIFWHNNQKMAAAYWMPLPTPPSDTLRGEVK